MTVNKFDILISSTKRQGNLKLKYSLRYPFLTESTLKFKLTDTNGLTSLPQKFEGISTNECANILK